MTAKQLKDVYQLKLKVAKSQKSLPYSQIKNRKVASSRPVYYLILNSLGQRSQYISINFSLHKQSENPKMCYCATVYYSQLYGIQNRFCDFSSFLFIKEVLLPWRTVIEEVSHNLFFALWSQIIKMGLRRPLEFIALKWTRREIQTSTKDSNACWRTRRTSTSISSGQIDIFFSHSKFRKLQQQSTFLTFPVCF